MSKSTVAKLRAELAAAVQEYRQDTGHAARLAQRGDKMATAAQALLDALDAQPSRRRKPYRLTFQHTSGSLQGRILRDSFRSLDEAVSKMRIPASAGARVELTVDSADGYIPITPRELADAGYPEYLSSGQYGGQYGDAHITLDR